MTLLSRLSHTGMGRIRGRYLGGSVVVVAAMMVVAVPAGVHAAAATSTVHPTSALHMVSLGVLPADSQSNATAVNDLGEVVGYGDHHAFLWRSGQMIDLGTLGGGQSAAFAINNSGDVVGESSTAGGQQHAFLWRNGQMTDLGALRPGDFSTATGINDSGVVVGTSSSGKPNGVRAFRWQGGVMTALVPAGKVFAPTAVNNGGVIVGSAYTAAAGYPGNPALWKHGKLTVLESTRVGIAFAINTNGFVAGYQEPGAGSGQSAFVWHSGQLRNLPGLSGGTFTQARGINDHGDVVGDGGVSRDQAILWTGCASTCSVPRLLPGSTGTSVSFATDINGQGQIAGNFATDNTTNFTAVLWTQ